MITSVTLKQARLLANLSQSEAAKDLGISENTLRSYEAGKTYPDVIVIDKIEKLYGIKYQDINFLCDSMTV